jgi:hypothetical protein
MLSRARCYGAGEIFEVGDGQAICEESAEAFFISNGEMNLAEALSIEAGELLENFLYRAVPQSLA